MIDYQSIGGKPSTLEEHTGLLCINDGRWMMLNKIALFQYFPVFL